MAYKDRTVNTGAHSTRDERTSLALLKGVSVSNIVKVADWASDCMFANVYLRDVREQESQFSTAVLRVGTTQENE